MGGAAPPDRRLETWKEVAAYLGKNERTVKRWEAERGLPVHRLPGDSRSRVHALASELDAWRSGVAANAPSAPEPATGPLREIWRAAIATLVLVGIVAVGAIVPPKPPRAPAATSPSAAPSSFPPPAVEVQRLYVEATEAWARRTPASLNEALAKYNAAIQRDPDYAEAYVGLAKTYLLLREYTVLPDGQAYSLARGAAQRAIALDEQLPEAHGAIAFVDANWLWEPQAAEREFRRAVALDPRDPTLHHWYGTFLIDQARPAEALRQLDTALALAAGSTAIEADRALTLDYLGNSTAAITQLSRLETASPSFKSPHEYLARIYLERGRDREFFDESDRAARLVDDLPRLAVVDAGRRALAAGGHRSALAAMRDVQIRQLQYGYGGAYAIAQSDAMLGEDAEACRYLQLARKRHEPVILEAAASPVFARMRKSPGACEVIDRPLVG